ncbi:hypothetical protein SAMN05444172_0101 [Burkholderia sp. GAS332]|nr:hypothetical protein SAMN05444172_0101 [Burkholderia sp. GAS332]
MSPLSLTSNARGHGFQMHHYRDCAGDPLSRGVEPLSLLIFLCGGVCQGSCRVNRYAACLYMSTDA